MERYLGNDLVSVYYVDFGRSEEVDLSRCVGYMSVSSACLMLYVPYADPYIFFRHGVVVIKWKSRHGHPWLSQASLC